MYGFSQQSILGVLIEGLSLIQVCFGEFQSVLHLADHANSGKSDCSIHIECRISMSTDGLIWTSADDCKQLAVALLKCLGKSCSECVVEDEQTLRLTFADRLQIKFHDESKLYESLVITSGDKTIVI